LLDLTMTKWRSVQRKSFHDNGNICASVSPSENLILHVIALKKLLTSLMPLPPSSNPSWRHKSPYLFVVVGEDEETNLSYHETRYGENLTLS
jgi:hypothetical protein